MSSALISIILLLIVWRIYKKDNRVNDEVPFLMIGGVLGIIALALIGVTAVVGIPHILNPEYYALQDLIGMVRGRVCQ